MTYEQALATARSLYAAVHPDNDPDELYLSGLADMLSKGFNVSIDKALGDILA